MLPLSSEFRFDLARSVELPEEEWDWLAQRMHARAYGRGEALFLEGQAARELYYIERGIVRLVAGAGEDEVNLGFDCERRFVTEMESLRTGGPARYRLEALESVECLALPGPVLEELTARHPGWGEVRRRHLEHLLERKARKEHRARTLTPEQRYQGLVARGSYLVRRVPQYHLASFLGIAPETLSRIRARMGSRGAAS